MTLRLKGVRCIDPQQALDARGDLIIESSGTATTQRLISDPPSAPDPSDGIDLTGKVVIPALCDLDQVVALPGTAGRDGPADVDTPVITSALRRLHSICRQISFDPQRFAALKTATPARWALNEALRTDCFWLDAETSEATLREVLKSLQSKVHLIVTPAQIKSLTGITSPGSLAALMGWRASVPGFEAERIRTLSDLAQETGVTVLFQRISTREGIEALAAARAGNAPVSGSVTISHLTFNNLDTGKGDGTYRITPPLGCEDDRQALLDGVRSGVISAITSSHEPVRDALKCLPFAEAEAGGSTVRAFLPALTSLIAAGELDWMSAIRATTTQPRSLLGEPPSDRWLVIDPHHGFRYDTEQIATSSRHSPFIGRLATGKLVGYVEGEVFHNLTEAGEMP